MKGSPSGGKLFRSKEHLQTEKYYVYSMEIVRDRGRPPKNDVTNFGHPSPIVMIFLNKDFSYIVTKSLTPSSPMAREVIYGQPLRR